MEVLGDQSNLVKPHLVFKASKFVRGEDQKQKNEDGVWEKDLWDKRVDVSFQENAWVDTKTNLYGLEKAKIILQKFDNCVQFEDNLSSHKSPSATAQ